jgi:hypothetical protein
MQLPAELGPRGAKFVRRQRVQFGSKPRLKIAPAEGWGCTATFQAIFLQQPYIYAFTPGESRAL